MNRYICIHTWLKCISAYRQCEHVCTICMYACTTCTNKENAYICAYKRCKYACIICMYGCFLCIHAHTAPCFSSQVDCEAQEQKPIVKLLPSFFFGSSIMRKETLEQRFSSHRAPELCPEKLLTIGFWVQNTLGNSCCRRLKATNASPKQQICKNAPKQKSQAMADPAHPKSQADAETAF